MVRYMQGERGWFVVRFGMQVFGGKIYIHALLLHICITGGIRMGSVIRGRGMSGPEAEPRSGGVVVVYSCGRGMCTWMLWHGKSRGISTGKVCRVP